MYSSDYVTGPGLVAAPFAAIRIFHPPYPERFFDISALIDSGSDASALPINKLSEIGVRLNEIKYMRGITGTRIQVQMFEVSIQIGPYTIPAIEAVGIPRIEDAVIGRDILNSLHCHLDGLAQEFRIVDGI